MLNMYENFKSKDFESNMNHITQVYRSPEATTYTQCTYHFCDNVTCMFSKYRKMSKTKFVGNWLQTNETFLDSDYG